MEKCINIASTWNFIVRSIINLVNLTIDHNESWINSTKNLSNRNISEYENETYCSTYGTDHKINRNNHNHHSGTCRKTRWYPVEHPLLCFYLLCSSWLQQGQKKSTKLIVEIEWKFAFGFAVLLVLAPGNFNRVLSGWNLLERRSELLWLTGQCRHFPLQSVDRCIVKCSRITSKSMSPILSWGIKKCEWNHVIY